ncbi:hypothetical protein D3C87_1608530 [compost metagenome]
MTPTLCAKRATSPRSWVMKIIAAPVSAVRSLSSSTICAWMVTSSAVVGSSAMTSRGRQERAMAIMTRWRMPPDISNG